VLASAAEKQSGGVMTAGFVLMTILAIMDLAFCAYLGFHHRDTPLPTFTAAFLLLSAAGITVSWYTYLEAAKEGISAHAQNAIGRLFMTIGFILLAMGYWLKG
jgi:drug/metabolite transporter (DMT)-like permease